jgi:hypothetical protein
MSWIHETGYGAALDHEGGVADVLEAGTNTSTPPDQLDPPGHRLALRLPVRLARN